MFELYFSALILVLLIAGLIKDVYQPSLLIFVALLLFVIGNVITIDEAFEGFSNTGMITVGFLFIVSAGLQASGIFEKSIIHLLGDRSTPIVFRYLRLLTAVSGFSAFLNNTPIVASLIPVIRGWAKKNGLASSKFLIPISYAAILGGMCTLIGTSTNLIIHGLLLEKGLDGFSFYELTRVGVPVAVIGLIFLSLFSHLLLPSRKELTAKLGDETREFVVEMKVSDEYPNIGKSVQDANLRHLEGLFLFQISRDGQVIAPVGPEEIIKSGDRLFFTGLPETIYELQKSPGLYVVRDLEFDLKNVDSDKLKTYEAVVSSTSRLIGQTVRDSNFRDTYQGVILAIHRAGSRIDKKIGDIEFQPNDTLFIMAKHGFEDRFYHDRDFALVSRSLDIYEKPQWKGNLALGLIVLMVLGASLNVVPIILGAAITASLMILFKILSVKDAKENVNWNVLLYIACSFGVAKGISNSGLSALVGETIVNVLDVFGPAGVIAGVFLLTSSFTWVITNNAVAAIMFPVVLSIAEVIPGDPRPYVITLALGASTCFASPLGYQTNLMVYSAGGYRFSDFMKLGVILNLMVGVVTIWLVYHFYF